MYLLSLSTSLRSLPRPRTTSVLPSSHLPLNRELTAVLTHKSRRVNCITVHTAGCVLALARTLFGAISVGERLAPNWRELELLNARWVAVALDSDPNGLVHIALLDGAQQVLIPLDGAAVYSSDHIA